MSAILFDLEDTTFTYNEGKQTAIIAGIYEGDRLEYKVDVTNHEVTTSYMKQDYELDELICNSAIVMAGNLIQVDFSSYEDGDQWISVFFKVIPCE